MSRSGLFLALLLSLPFGQAYSRTEAPLPTPELTPTPEAGAHVEGVVLERGTRAPLPDVNVYLLPHNLKAVTNGSGSFEFQSVPLGPFRYVVNIAGYERLEMGDEAKPGEVRRRKLFVQKVRYEGTFETRIVAKRDKLDASERSLGLDQFISAPGSGGDPIKAVANLPGINRSPGFLANVVIEGSEPQATGYLVDGHEVPLIFHFGGLSTVVFPEAIERVDYLSAGYGPEYGRALGGLVGVRVRQPRRDRWRGLAFVDVINAGGLVEGGLTAHSGLMLSFRQSYIGEVLKAVVGNRDDFDLTVAPRFTDATAIYDLDLSDDAHFRFTGIGSLDSLKFLLKNPANDDPFFRGTFKNETKFFRLIPQLEWKHSDRIESRWSIGAGWTDFLIATDQNRLGLNIWTLTPKLEVKSILSPAWTLFAGMDNRILFSKADVLLPNDYVAGGIFNPLSTGTLLSVKTSETDLSIAPYLRPVFHPAGSRWTLSPGIRLDYFGATGQTFIDPRAAVYYDIDPSLRLKTSGGRYHQPPEPRESNVDVGNPFIHAPSAWHLSIGADKDFRKGSTEGFFVSTDFFMRWFEDLVIRSNQLSQVGGVTRPEYFNNSGTGTSLGGKTSMTFRASPFNATLGYTLLRSRRSEPGVGSYPAQYDQTQNINIIGGVDLPRNWRISSRVRYVTGNPNTPIVGAFYDADNNVFIPERGPYFSQRLSPFFQADLRVDKKWIFDNWILCLYLDIQNMTNRKNVEQINYAYDYSASKAVSGLPIIPSLGLKGEF